MAKELTENGKRLRERRKQLKLSMEELADRVGYTSASRKTIIYHMEINDTDIPLSRLPAFASALNTNVYYLLGMSGHVDVTDNEILKLVEEKEASQKEHHDP